MRWIQRSLPPGGYAFFQVAGILNGRSNDASVFYKAEGEIRRALQDDPRCGRAHSVLGLIYLLQGRKELVNGELDQALAENPLDPTAQAGCSTTTASTAITAAPSRSSTG